jgi:hypothetical protein
VPRTWLGSVRHARALVGNCCPGNLRVMPPIIVVAIGLALSVHSVRVPPGGILQQSAPPAKSAGQDRSRAASRADVDRLRQELARRHAKLRALIAEIEDLEKQLADASGAALPDDAQQPPSLDPAVSEPRAPDAGEAPSAPRSATATPASSPGGLLARLRSDFLAAYPQVPKESDRSEFIGFEARVKLWCHSRIKYPFKVRWIGQIVGRPYERSASVSVELQVRFRDDVNEQSRKVVVSTATYESIRGAASGSMIAFEGTVYPMLKYSNSRHASDGGALVGPGIPLDFTFDINRASPVAGAAPK